MRAAEREPTTPMKPAVASRGASAGACRDDAILVTDSGQHTEPRRAARRRCGQGTISRYPACSPPWPAACLMRSPPASPFPGRPIFAVVGDGGLAMQLGEFSTAVRTGFR